MLQAAAVVSPDWAARNRAADAEFFPGAGLVGQGSMQFFTEFSSFPMALLMSFFPAVIIAASVRFTYKRSG